MVKCYSINVRGLRNKRKRNQIFQFLKQKDYDIIFVQESHGTQEIESIWRNEWGADITFSNFSSRARGVMTLFGKGIEVLCHKNDSQGRLDINEIKIEDEVYTLINVYAPNEDNERITFFEALSTNIASNLSNANLIMAGDFNVALTADDRKSNVSVVQPSANTLKRLIEEHNLIDIWREKHPNLKQYTWCRQSSNVMSRLDYFLISKSLTMLCKSTKIKESVHTDHKLIYLELLKSRNHERGPGFWKLNSSLLKDQEYINQISELIIAKKQEYNDIDDKRIIWDLLKFDIQTKTISISKQKSREKRKLEKEMTENCERLYNKMCNDNLTESEQEEYLKCKDILEDIYKYKEQGAYIRSRADFIEKNERSNKYFFNKEKNTFEKKTVDSLKINDNIVNNPKEILTQLKKFYFELYATKNPDLMCDEFNSLLNVNNFSRLTVEDRDSCDGYVSVNECHIALNRMKNGKSPGCDGLTVEFYKTFWPVLGEIITEVFNYSVNKGELSESQKRGVITLLQKKGKDPLLIKNWRPVSLTNVDYKILTKSLAIRIEKVLPKLINENQSGFVKGRLITENIRLIDDIIETLKRRRETGLILLLDFEKAFDSVEWIYMHKILEKFNFGESFRKWVEICYTNISSTVINNGFTSGWFEIKRGVRQGCPLSTSLFILCIELLAHLIRNNDNIKGLDFGNQCHKISLFADDATCLLKDSNSVINVFAVTEIFSKYSGLRLNVSKSLLVYIGPWKIKPVLPFEIQTTCDTFNVLGIELGNNDKLCNDKNILEKIKKLSHTLNMWSQRNLTIIGKILIAKSFGMSNLIYSLTCVPSKDSDIQQAQKVINKFIWKGKPNKIKHSSMIGDYSKCGIRAPDLLSMKKSLRLAWIPRLWHNKPINFLITNQFNRYGGLRLLLHSNYDPKQIYMSEFYKEILTFFREIHDQRIFGGVL